MDNVVKLVFESIAIGSGLTDFVNKTKESLTNSGKLAQGVSVLSQSFGVLGSTVGKAVSMFLQGGIWGAAAHGITLVIGCIKKWREETKLAAEENSRAFKDTIAKANELASSIKESYIKASEAIDAAAKKKKKDDIELTKIQTKAELELAEAKLRSSGKTKEADAISKKQLESEIKAKKESAAVTVDAAKKKLEYAKKQATGLPGWKNKEFKFDPKEWEKQRRLRNGNIMRLNKQIKDAESANAHHASAGGLSPDDLDSKKKELEFEKEAKKAFIVQMKTARQAAENIKDSERTLSKAMKEEKAVELESNKSIIIYNSRAAKADRDEQIKKRLRA